MNDPQNGHDSDCQRFSALMAERDDPTAMLRVDRQFTDAHLKSCRQCQHEQRLLQRIDSQWLSQADRLPEPDAEVRYHLRAAVRRRQPRPFAERVLGWLKLPGPAYGIALAALLLAGVTRPDRDPSAPLAAVAPVPSLADTSALLPVLTRTNSDNVLANFRLVDRLRRIDRPDSAARLLPHRHSGG